MIPLEQLYNLFLHSDGITTDSRVKEKNKIFFALKGKNFNGNLFAGNALQNGCSLAIVDDPSFVKGESYILVDNTLKCLQELANMHRRHTHIPLLGLTGSNGKTTTKELISSVLSRKYKVLSTQGNLNNHIGVPLTILGIKNHEFAVIEMGANHPGEINELCNIALPDFGIITNIGKAHLEGFGSLSAVKKAKDELFDHLNNHKGTIFVNYGNPVLKEIAERTTLSKVIYGEDANSVCRGQITENKLRIKPVISWDWKQKKGTTAIQTQLTGNYNLENLLAAFTAGLYFDVEERDIIQAIEGYIPANNRSQLLNTSGNNTLILDAYNANPTSMNQALIHFASQKGIHKTVILGDMLELGDYATEEHETIISILRDNKNIKVFLVGHEFKKANKSNDFISFPDTSSLIAHLQKNPILNNLILIKGSRGMQLERVVEYL